MRIMRNTPTRHAAGRLLLVSALCAVGAFGPVRAAEYVDPADELNPPRMPYNRSARGGTPLNALPAPAAGETLAYFFPSDNDATATVLTLLNTDAVDHVVAVRGYNHDGTLVLAQNITMPATSMRRLVSDSVVATAPPSWVGPSGGNTAGVNPITVNFTDFTFFASVSLPKGVKVDGYTLVNAGTGTIDPRKDQGAVPLRFMTSPFYLP